MGTCGMFEPPNHALCSIGRKPKLPHLVFAKRCSVKTSLPVTMLSKHVCAFAKDTRLGTLYQQVHASSSAAEPTNAAFGQLG